LKPGIDLLAGTVDCHVHACPHLTARSVDVFQATREAAAVGMRAIGLMDNFINSAGYTALAMRELGDLGVDVFGGIIMERPAGGISAEAVRIALQYGYGPGTAARFISLPTHHTRNIARYEGRYLAYIEACLEIPEKGPLPDPLPEILDLVSESDVVLNTGHISGPEAVRLVEEAKQRGVTRILVPSGYYAADEVKAITANGAFAEFSFYALSHATQLEFTHADEEAHTIAAVTVARMAELVRAAGPKQAILSSDCGIFILPPPVEGFREFLLLMEGAGFNRTDLRSMAAGNPAKLFKVRERTNP